MLVVTVSWPCLESLEILSEWSVNFVYVAYIVGTYIFFTRTYLPIFWKKTNISEWDTCKCVLTNQQVAWGRWGSGGGDGVEGRWGQGWWWGCGEMRVKNGGWVEGRWGSGCADWQKFLFCISSSLQYQQLLQIKQCKIFITS